MVVESVGAIVHHPGLVVVAIEAMLGNDAGWEKGVSSLIISSRALVTVSSVMVMSSMRDCTAGFVPGFVPGFVFWSMVARAIGFKGQLC